MSYAAPLELLTDASGSVTFGWVDQGVFYARFSHGLSAELGAAYANRLRAIVQATPSIRYFSDARALENYDLLARSAFLRAVMAQRRKFTSIDMLTWPGDLSPAVVASLGEPILVTCDPVVFETRLFATAPRARWKLDPKSEAIAQQRWPLRR